MNHLKLTFDRALARGTKWQLLIIGGIIIVSILLSYVLLSLSGDWEQFCEDHDINKFMLPLYLLIDQNLYNEVYLSGYDATTQSVVGYGKGLSLASGITFLIGVIFFNGAIIAILSDFIKRRVDNYQNGVTRYLKSGHHVIMGYDDVVPSIISQILKEKPNADILLLSSVPAVEIHEKLRESVARKSLANIVVNYGHRTSNEYYKDIHLEAAEQIFIAGDRSKPQHDAINVECVESICNYLASKSSHTVKRITCMFEDLDTYASFRTTDIFSAITCKLNIEFVPYNFYVSWARCVFVNRSYIGKADQKQHPYPALCRHQIEKEDDNEHFVHLVFVGMSNFAVTFANEAAHLLHFPNGKKKHTLITFIDLKADKEMPVFVTRNHHFFEIQGYSYMDYTQSDRLIIAKPYDPSIFSGEDANFLDVDFEFIKGDVFTPEVQNLIYEWAKDEKQSLSVFIAMSNQRDNFALAMNMPDAVYNNNVPVFVRQDSSDNFITLLQEADSKAPRKGDPEYRTYEDGQLHVKPTHGRYDHIFPFGMNDTSFVADEKVIMRAKLANYLYCTMSNSKFQSLTELAVQSFATILKEANNLWKGLTVAEKWSNMYYAYSLDYKLLALRAIRHLNMDDTTHDSDALSEKESEIIGKIEHNRWNVEKLLMGYRKPKEEEDLYKKPQEVKSLLKNNKNLFIHAQIRPFDKLSEDMQKVDKEFAKYIPWICNFNNNSQLCEKQ